MSTHLKLDCFEVSQGPIVKLYIGKASFSELRQVYTVSPRQPRADDPYLSDAAAANARTFQRPPNDARVREIGGFIRERLTRDDPTKKEAIFPGVVILGLLVDVELSQNEDADPDPSAAHLLRASDGCHTSVLIPNRSGALFVIDGQHRLNGLAWLIQQLEGEIAAHEGEAAGPELIELRRIRDLALNLEVPLSLLVDFDLVEQSIVFATVNFKQKSVQRSFYYDIFGAFETDAVTPLSFSHELAIHLNNFTSSPLRGMIKLLGSGPGLVSQAFLVERLIPLVDPQQERAVFKSYLSRRRAGELDGSRHLAQILRNFFTALKTTFPYAWPIEGEDGYSARKYEFILCKSMFLSGFLGVLREIYKIVTLDMAPADEFELSRAQVLSAELFAELLEGIDKVTRQTTIGLSPEDAKKVALAKSIFSKNSQWAVGGSGKVERLIYLDLRNELLSRYRTVVRNPESHYARAAAALNGPRRAASLLDTENFWAATEAAWLSTRAMPSTSIGT